MGQIPPFIADHANLIAVVIGIIFAAAVAFGRRRAPCAARTRIKS